MNTDQPPPTTDLNHLNELEAKATPGPWINSHFSVETEDRQRKIAHTGLGFGKSEESEANAQFIAVLKTAFPTMSKELAELREENSKLKDLADGYHKANGWNDTQDNLDEFVENLVTEVTQHQLSERSVIGQVKTFLQRECILCDENIQACAENDYEDEENLLRLRKSIYQSALHHLEAGRRNRERLTEAVSLVEELVQHTSPYIFKTGHEKSRVQEVVEWLGPDQSADIKEYMESIKTLPQPKGESPP